ncbi:MAG: hypothetical protein ACYSTI_13710 [Planctomycetota bacterium]|jgi:hypothetical protein
MAWRVIEKEVREILPEDFPSTIKLRAFIDGANALTDKVSANDTNSLLNAALLKEIERYLAAHFASRSKDERLATEEEQLDAKAKYKEHSYLEDARMYDLTGYLAKMEKGSIVPQAFWGGKPVSDQTLYRDRD